MDLVLARVFAGIERQLQGILLCLWGYIHVGAFPDVMKLLMDPECLG
jgi:hypothetical protein